MTAWQLYWILMLDNVCVALITGFAISITCTVLAVIFGAILRDGLSETDTATGKKLHRIAPVLVAFALVFGIAATLTPNTKQMAVILVLPKIANAENIESVQSEAGDIYGLAKRWLEEQVHANALKAQEDEP